MGEGEHFVQLQEVAREEKADNLKKEDYKQGNKQQVFADKLGFKHSESIGAQGSSLEATVRHYMTQPRSASSKIINQSFTRKRGNNQNNIKKKRELSWDEAKMIPQILDAEKSYATRHLNISSSSTKEEEHYYLGRAFRWSNRLSLADGDLYFTNIIGDVGTVFSGLTNDEVRKDPGAFAKFYSTETLIAVDEYLQDLVAGNIQKGCICTWNCRPEYDLIIEIELLDIYFYKDVTQKSCVLQFCETRLVTEAFARYGDIVTKIIAEHREIADHRLGNKFRIMHLLCQESLAHYGDTSAKNNLLDLDKFFERIGYEIAIRRNFLDNLPPIQPISVQTFFSEEFTTIDTDIQVFDQNNFRMNPKTTHVLFFNHHKQPLSPIILQVLLLQDIASNCFKHSNGCATIKVTPQYFIVSNSLQKKKSSGARTASRHVGLESLQRVASDTGISIQFSSSSEDFHVKVEIDIETSSNNTIALPLIRNTSETSIFSESSNKCDELNISDITWIIVDDEPLICKRFANIAKKAFEVEVIVASNPVEIHSLISLLTYITAYKSKRATVVIYDENLREFDPETRNLISVSGTVLRDRVHAHEFLKPRLISNPPTLFSVSASASHVDDPRLLLTIGKSGSVINDMNKILAALKPILLETTTSK
mmetsp:Transcript_24021/g.30048  ORF Transcript_24021/g.30048 Transcript_24021/m.30048 type:complete len:650 (+) Transcript_24021:161-2110(+)